MDSLNNERGTFLRFPDSIVCLILAHLGDIELYAFSQLCHRIHQLALALYFSRHGISNPVESSEVDLRYSKYSEEGQFDVLHALQMALFVPSIRRLSICFSETDELKRYIETWVSDSEVSLHGPILEPPTLTLRSLQATAERLCGEIRRCRRLLEKLTSVDEVTVTFPGSLRWNLEEVQREHDHNIFEWLPIHDFLTLVVEKSCSSLTVQSVYFPQPAPPSIACDGKSLSKVTRLMNTIQRKHKGKNLKKYSYPGTKHALLPSWQALTRSSLTTFCIDSPIFLFSPSVQWTLSVIQWSQITSLRLSYLDLSMADWDKFASNITAAVPELTELTLVHCTIELGSLTYLLDHLPRLTNLSINDSGETFYSLFPRLFSTFSRWILPKLHNLTTLCAPHAYVSLFFAHLGPPPCLESLKLLPCHISHIDNQCEHIFVHMPQIIHHLRERNHTIKPHLVISFSWDGSGGSMSTNIDSSLCMDEEAKHALRTISHLTVENFDPVVNNLNLRTLSAFPQWLAIFPSLRGVTWSGTSPGNDWEYFYRLIRAISRACPDVETITVNKEEYSTAAVLASLVGSTNSDQVVRFLDLPTDILLIIFESLSFELFNLSLLCRRLHFLALPVFLSRKGLPDPCMTSDVRLGLAPLEIDALSALTISLFVPSIKCLTCSFPITWHLHEHLNHIRRLTRLIDRLTSVEQVSLKFSPSYYQTQVSNPIARDRLWGQCYSHFGDLFSAITRKSCTFLLIKGRPGLSESWSYTPPMPLPCLPSIQRLTLIDYNQSFARWIFSTLKSCRITRLEITGPADCTDWPDVVPTDILDLTIFGKYGSKSKTLMFLSQCPLLTSLKLDGELSRQFYASLDTDRPIPNFVHLVTLTVHPSYLSYFLSSTPMPLPHLSSLTLTLYDIKDASWILSSIIERVRERYPSSPTLSVDLDGVYDAVSITESMDAIVAFGGKWRHACRHLTGLTMAYDDEWWVSGSGSQQHSSIPPLISRWVALFLGIENFSMKSKYEYDKCEPPIAFVESITQACPNITTIEWDSKPVFRRFEALTI